MFTSDSQAFLALARSKPKAQWQAEFAQAKQGLEKYSARIGVVTIFLIIRRATSPDLSLYGAELFLITSLLSLSTAAEVVEVLPWLRIRPALHWIIVVLVSVLGPLSMVYWTFVGNQVARSAVIFNLACEVLDQRHQAGLLAESGATLSAPQEE